GEKLFSDVGGVGALRMVLRALADFIYPRSCVGCGRMTKSGGAFCTECWAQVTFIQRPYCEVLGIPFAHDHGPGILSAEAIAEPPPFQRLRAAT
uniref:double zinc ribbon domain-containing protein n=1 Tax=Klebsiella pneumoniae TaxID=573 RepID=UPI001C8F3798